MCQLHPSTANEQRSPVESPSRLTTEFRTSTQVIVRQNRVAGYSRQQLTSDHSLFTKDPPIIDIAAKVS